MSVQTYTAKYLIDLALNGHYLFTEEIDQTVRRLNRRHGDRARTRMSALPDVAEYAGRHEIEYWAECLREIGRELDAANRPASDCREPSLFESP